MTTTRRKPRPGGASWADAQMNAPGGYVPDHKHGVRSDQSREILAWLEARAPQAFSSAEIHQAVIVKRWPTWTQGRTTSRLSSFCHQGTLKAIQGGLYMFIVSKALEG